MAGYHKSVLLKESIDALMSHRYSEPPRRGLARLDGWYLDSTLGDGGHTLEILKRGGNVVGIDVDPAAIERAKERFGEYLLIQGNFRDIKSLIGQRTDIPVSKFAGAIFDLGVSSLQLETPDRGFSFQEGPLDMRMDPSLRITAADLINNLSRKELYELFSKLGEEKYSRRLAEAVVRARGLRPITTTAQLAEMAVREVRSDRLHPATRIFQALRIAVNSELEALEEGLEEAKDLIEAEGRIVVISFHSLEDRIVKNTFKRWAKGGIGEIMTKKPLVPSEKEVTDNPRSRSAKMRVFKKT